MDEYNVFLLHKKKGGPKTKDQIKKKRKKAIRLKLRPKKEGRPLQARPEVEYLHRLPR